MTGWLACAPCSGRSHEGGRRSIQAGRTSSDDGTEGGSISVTSGYGSVNSSGSFSVRTADAGTAGISSALHFRTGTSKLGSSGAVEVRSGTAHHGVGGSISVVVGTGNSASAGRITVSAGAVSVAGGTGGRVELASGFG